MWCALAAGVREYAEWFRATRHTCAGRHQPSGHAALHAVFQRTTRTTTTKYNREQRTLLHKQRTKTPPALCRHTSWRWCCVRVLILPSSAFLSNWTTGANGCCTREKQRESRDVTSSKSCCMLWRINQFRDMNMMFGTQSVSQSATKCHRWGAAKKRRETQVVSESSNNLCCTRVEVYVDDIIGGFQAMFAFLQIDCLTSDWLCWDMRQPFQCVQVLFEGSNKVLIVFRTPQHNFTNKS